MTDLLDGPRQEPHSGKPAQSLVILLHGYGSNGKDLITLADTWKEHLPDTLFIAPNAPHQCEGGMGYEWFPLTDSAPEARWTGVQAAAPTLHAFIDHQLEANNLEEKQLAIVGFSQGAMMTLHIGLRRENSPACLISYSGLLVGEDHLIKEARVAPPIMMLHGDKDEVIPIGALSFSIKALEEAGQTALPYVMEETGHNINNEGIVLGSEFISGTLGLEFMSKKDT